MMSITKTGIEAAKAGSDTAVEYFQCSPATDTKSAKMDFVTEADTTAQRRIIERIRSDYPDATIVAEEGNELKTIPPDGNAWIIDPIDGTTNFVHEMPFWTTSVAIVQNGETEAGISIVPALQQIFQVDQGNPQKNGEPISVSEKSDLETFCVAPILRYGSERDDQFAKLLDSLLKEFGDIRRFGSAQLTLALVASGSLDATVSTQPDPNPWDTVAGVHMVKQAGGTVTDIYGDPWEPDSQGIVATNGKEHKQVLDIIKQLKRP